MSTKTQAQAPPQLPPGTLLQRAAQSFEVEPDMAGVLQGVRAMRNGKVHVRVLLMPSVKNGAVVACEGRLEGGLAESLDLDPTVTAFRGQPFFLPGPNGRDLVCDFVVKDRQARYTVIDVKPSGDLELPKVKTRMRFVRELMAEQRLPYRVISESELERQPARQIRRQLSKGRGCMLTENQLDQLIAAIRADANTVGRARDVARSLGLSAFAVEKLAVLNRLRFPIDAPWGESTAIGVHDDHTYASRPGWGAIKDCLVHF